MSPDEIKALTETVKMLKEMAESKPNEWLPVYAALGGAIAGSIASFLPTLFLEKRRDHKYSRQIQSSLLAEVSALLEIISHRKYLESIQEVIESLSTQPAGTTYSFAVDVPPHYSRVYQENCINIGVVQEDVAREIVVFHQLIDAVVQDVKLCGHVSEGAELEAFIEMEAILKRAIEIGNKIVNAHNRVAGGL